MARAIDRESTVAAGPGQASGAAAVIATAHSPARQAREPSDIA